jgi:hypothetical protein
LTLCYLCQTGFRVLLLICTRFNLTYMIESVSDFRKVPTVWYFLFFILFLNYYCAFSQSHSHEVCPYHGPNMYMNQIGNTLPIENGCYSLIGVLSFFVVQMGDTMCIVIEVSNIPRYVLRKLQILNVY